jgi:hypothetical protein
MVYKAILSNRNLIESEKILLAKLTKDMKTLKLKGTSNLGSEKQDESQVTLSKCEKKIIPRFESTKMKEIRFCFGSN